ncbi:MAG: tyrosine--tRNA ligase [Actinomycetia bacterium]|nr:tyrosine--tRNA ligase [Actinomycetes bacterium]
MDRKKDNLINKEIERQFNIIIDKAKDVVTQDELKQKLFKSISENKPLKIKLGIDLTAPDVHLGHTVVLNKLKEFQDLGHIAILILGDYTTRVGDPSGRTKVRPILSIEEIKKNAETFRNQVFRILDPDKTELVNNSEWLEPMKLEDVINITSRYTLARLLERNDFSYRFKNNIPISIMEILYPLMQAYDSVVIKADIELGGTDQTFNLLTGRDMQREFNQEPQVIITFPLLVGTDGIEKMSKSLGNYIGITEEKDIMFAKIMSISDDVMFDYFKLISNFTYSKIEELERNVSEGKVNPGDVKRKLARNIVNIYQGKNSGEEAERIFNTKFKIGFFDKELINEISRPFKLKPEMFKNGKIWLIKLLNEVGYARSNSEARRLVEQKGIKLDNDILSNVDLELGIDELRGKILQRGKREYIKFV